MGLHAAVFRDYVERVYGSWGDAFEQSLFERLAGENISEVILLGDSRVGAVHWRYESGAVYIELFEVQPDFQGQGIGAMALQSMLARAEWPDEVRPSIGRSNPARRLYERMGFQIEREDDRRFHLLRVRVSS